MNFSQLKGRDCSGGDDGPDNPAYDRLDPFFNQTLLTFNYTKAYLNNNYFSCPWNGSYPW